MKHRREVWDVRFVLVFKTRGQGNIKRIKETSLTFTQPKRGSQQLNFNSTTLAVGILTVRVVHTRQVFHLMACLLDVDATLPCMEKAFLLEADIHGHPRNVSCERPIWLRCAIAQSTPITPAELILHAYRFRHRFQTWRGMIHYLALEGSATFE